MLRRARALIVAGEIDCERKVPQHNIWGQKYATSTLNVVENVSIPSIRCDSEKRNLS